jgi:hypothetical protein
MHIYIYILYVQSTNKSYIWIIAPYGAETWTLPVVDKKNLESFKMWCWRRSAGPIM